MLSNIAAIRAVTVEFAKQYIQPFAWIGLGIIVILLVIIGLLVFTVSAWWGLLIIPVVLFSIVASAIWLLVCFILGRISPHLNVRQKAATKQFVTKLQFATETIQTPYPIIVFYVVRDIILRKDTGFISEVTQQSKTLRPDFEELKQLF
ncbi:MAG: hypothetical protein JWO55_453 [Candidatus Saccharibacteria bacterium]|jgi:hypothetical protein|nr:hypothetical protein [Candidatus Saccharibacteria bacterium]